MPTKLRSGALGLVVAVGAMAGAARSAVAQQPADDVKPIDVTRLRPNTGLAYQVEGGEGGGQATGASRTARPPGSRPRRYWASFPRLRTLPDGSRCLWVERRAFPDPLGAAAARDTENVLWQITAADYPLCPGAAAPGASPAAQAAAFWRVAGEDLLPRPRPRIAPGYMLAGKLAYLEAGSVPTARFEHPTPLGLLTIEATSALYVDWGDGSGLDGPHDGPGAPWPTGTITHHWTEARTYDVRVVQRWTARWRLGAASGRLAGLATEGGLDDFEVRQLQAVRNR